MSAVINVNGVQYTLDQPVEDARETINSAILRGSGTAEVTIRDGAARGIPLLIRVEGVFAVTVHEKQRGKVTAF